MTKLKSILLVTTGIIIGASAISVLNAQSNAPYFEVAAINVTDQAGYEASGVDKVRDAIKAAGGKLIAGGYNKAVAIDSDVPAANRFLIFMYPSKEASDKVQNEIIKPWAEKVKGKYTDRYRIYGVEAATEMK
jgi:uncharacterized protein (DUF1330 family)